MQRLLIMICLLCNMAVVCEASILNLHKYIPNAVNYIRNLLRISEAETQIAIKDRHYEPVMQRNIFVHPTPVVPTTAPLPTVPTAQVLTTAPTPPNSFITVTPSLVVGNATIAPIPSISRMERLRLLTELFRLQQQMSATFHCSLSRLFLQVGN
jgi:hypothetical protein